MDLGFETFGNATILAYDSGSPVVVTDPWIRGAQYFGSWTLPYTVSARQMESLRQVRYVWLSHGHPDHLNLPSLELFRDKILLVPRHRGDRIASDLRQAGFKVQDLPSGEWVQLSARVRVISYADWNQDAALLIALGDKCGVLNLNDGGALGTRARLRRQLSEFHTRFVLRLINYGDADMMNFFAESGERIKPTAAHPKTLGYDYNHLLKRWDGTHTAPFSCTHAYARTDSQWASAYETPQEAHAQGFNPALGTFIPGYFMYDALKDEITLTPMERAEHVFRRPEEFGDHWEEPLEAGERAEVAAYFRKFEHLRDKFAFINFRVGSRDNVIDLAGPKGVGITFEAPRKSLLEAVRWEIFDDLLIGNFTKTTLHGGLRSLYPDFTPYVCKYGDNGRAFSSLELRDYFGAYRSAAGLQGWLDQIRVEGTRKVRTLLSANRGVYLFARRMYGHLKS
jgi:L-ascorbate metabolism protein UlaG (beta-lactamase superfamily)